MLTKTLIGYIDLGDPLTTFANVDEDTDPIASHALAFLVRGLCTNLKHVVAYYFTGNVTSFQLMPLFWKVVVALETTVKLSVILSILYIYIYIYIYIYTGLPLSSKCQSGSRTATPKTFEVTAFSSEFWKNFCSYAMPGANCALYGCSTSRKCGLSLFKLPCPRVGDGQETKASKEIARKEWLHVILRTRKMTPELKQRIDENKIFLCERHFKAELISDRKY